MKRFLVACSLSLCIHLAILAYLNENVRTDFFQDQGLGESRVTLVEFPSSVTGLKEGREGTGPIYKKSTAVGETQKLNTSTKRDNTEKTGEIPSQKSEEAKEEEKIPQKPPEIGTGTLAREMGTASLETAKESLPSETEKKEKAEIEPEKENKKRSIVKKQPEAKGEPSPQKDSTESVIENSSPEPRQDRIFSKKLADEINGKTGNITVDKKGKKGATSSESGVYNSEKTDLQDVIRKVTQKDIAKRVIPHYPRASRLRQEEGIVVILVKVSGGKILTAEIESSSGHERLDRSALEAVRKWTFTLQGEETLEIPVIFRLNRQR